MYFIISNTNFTGKQKGVVLLRGFNNKYPFHNCERFHLLVNHHVGRKSFNFQSHKSKVSSMKYRRRGTVHYF